MSSKISALPAATEADDVDLLTIVQAGANKKCEVVLLLTAPPSGVVNLNGGDGAIVSVGDDGSVGIATGTTAALEVFGVGGSGLLVDTSGNVSLTSVGAAVTLSNDAGAGTVQVQITGNVNIEDGGPGTKVHVSYQPAAVGNWAGAPNDVIDAIDRIAAVVSNSGVTPIP